MTVTSPARAEEISAQKDVRLRIHESHRGIEFEVLDENDRSRILAGRAFKRDVLRALASRDVGAIEKRVGGLRRYTTGTMVGFAIAALSFGRDLTSTALLGSALWPGWQAPSEIGGMLVCFGLACGVEGSIRRAQREIGHARVLGIFFARCQPRKRSEFVAFVAELERALVFADRHACGGDLRSSGLR